MLKSYQTEIQPDTLYQTNLMGLSGVGAQLAASIEVYGGEVTIYGSQNEPTSAPTGMSVGRASFEGIESFGVIPNYIYVTGTPESIILSGVEAVEVE